MTAPTRRWFDPRRWLPIGRRANPPAEPSPDAYRLAKDEVLGDLPGLNTSDDVGSGRVYIKGVKIDSKPIRLASDQKLVLERSGSTPLEVTTTGEKRSLIDDHTWLTDADCRAFDAKGDTTNPVSARLFTRRRRFAKLKSGPGVALVVSVVAGIFAAAATLSNAVFPPPPDVQADRLLAVQVWATEPLTELPPTPDPAAKITVATELEQRSVQATMCVQSMLGNLKPPAQIAQLNCADMKPSWWRKYLAPVLGALASFVVAATAGVTAWRRTGYREAL